VCIETPVALQAVGARNTHSKLKSSNIRNRAAQQWHKHGQWPAMATSGQSNRGGERMDAVASGGAFLYDPRIIRMQGEE
jgi:hypothetical protein